MFAFDNYISAQISDPKPRYKKELIVDLEGFEKGEEFLKSKIECIQSNWQPSTGNIIEYVESKNYSIFGDEFLLLFHQITKNGCIDRFNMEAGVYMFICDLGENQEISKKERRLSSVEKLFGAMPRIFFSIF